MTIDAQLEAVLFFKSEPLSVKRLGDLLGVDKKSVEAGLKSLETKLAGGGITIVRTGDEIELRTSPDAARVVEKLLREELARDLGKAGAEVLAIVLYRARATRRDIDWIRGVNSTFTLRELVARGLVARRANPEDARGFIYEPTTELLAHLGVSRVEELPDYAEAAKELDAFAAKTENEQHE